MSYKNLSVERLETYKARAEELVEKARAEYQAAEKKFSAENANLRAINLEIESRVPVTLENALVTYLPSGENVRGMRFLEQRSWKGEWKDSGLRSSGTYSPDTNQRRLTVYSRSDWSDEKLDTQAEFIREAAALVLPGVSYRATLKYLSKEVPASELICFDISAPDNCEYHSYVLGLDDAGIWVIFDSYNRYSVSSPEIHGTLEACLRYIRDYISGLESDY